MRTDARRRGHRHRDRRRRPVRGAGRGAGRRRDRPATHAPPEARHPRAAGGARGCADDDRGGDGGPLASGDATAAWRSSPIPTRSPPSRTIRCRSSTSGPSACSIPARSTRWRASRPSGATPGRTARHRCIGTSRPANTSTRPTDGPISDAVGPEGLYLNGGYSGHGIMAGAGRQPAGGRPAHRSCGPGDEPVPPGPRLRRSGARHPLDQDHRWIELNHARTRACEHAVAVLADARRCTAVRAATGAAAR